MSGSARLGRPRVVEVKAVVLAVGPLEGVVHVRQGVGPGVEGLEKLSVGESVSALHTLDAGSHLGNDGDGGHGSLVKTEGRHEGVCWVSYGWGVKRGVTQGSQGDGRVQSHTAEGPSRWYG